MKFKKYLMFLLVAALAVVLVACGGETDEGNTEETDNSSGETEGSDDAAELEGSVVIDGSGTVYPLMQRIAEEYMVNEQQGVSVEVSRAGTGAGFDRFLAENGTDFNDASRLIKEEEQAKAEEL